MYNQEDETQHKTQLMTPTDVRLLASLNFNVETSFLSFKTAGLTRAKDLTKRNSEYFNWVFSRRVDFSPAYQTEYILLLQPVPISHWNLS